MLCRTDAVSLSTNFAENYGGYSPDTVFTADTLDIRWNGTTPGWNGWDLESPFLLEGSSGMVVEFQYLGSTTSTINARAAMLASADRCLDAGHPASATGSHMSFLTCMRIHYTQTGTGEGGEQPLLLEIHPTCNPASGWVSLTVSSPDWTAGELKVYGSDGRLLQTAWEGRLEPGGNSLWWDPAGFPEGVYHLLLETGSGRASTTAVLLD